jgi:hypothetical protein
MISRITVTAYAVVVTLVTYLLAEWVNADLQVPDPIGSFGGATRDMTAFDVLLVTCAVGLFAIGSAAVLDRFIGNGKRVWSIVAVVILVGSIIPLFSMDLGGVTLLWQLMLHLVFGLTLIWGFWKTWEQT